MNRKCFGFKVKYNNWGSYTSLFYAYYFCKAKVISPTFKSSVQSHASSIVYFTGYLELFSSGLVQLSAAAVDHKDGAIL